MKSINKLLIFGLNVILSCFVLGLVYSLVYNKIERGAEKEEAIFQDYHKVDEKLARFNAVKASIDEQKGEILDDIRTYQDFMYSNEQNSGSYRAKVISVLEKVGIPLKEKQKGGTFTGNATLKQKSGVTQIEMTANYDQMCRFLFEIEKFSIVQELKMDYKNNVSLKCVPVQYSKDIDDYFNDKKDLKPTNKDKTSLEVVSYFEEVIERTQKIKKELGKVPTWDDFKPVPRSPFYKYETPKASSGGGKAYYNGPAPAISMDGIMYDTVDPIVIIGGKFYHLGDTYKGAKIIKVNQSSMQADFNGKIFTYKMKY
ncbi:MAG: hypothetical protein II816_05775 [Elusimicrobia bacterium]|nr:hypothetical protein [Elusimicrobiota bacterium]